MNWLLFINLFSYYYFVFNSWSGPPRRQTVCRSGGRFEPDIPSGAGLSQSINHHSYYSVQRANVRDKVAQYLVWRLGRKYDKTQTLSFHVLCTQFRACHNRSTALYVRRNLASLSRCLFFVTTPPYSTENGPTNRRHWFNKERKLRGLDFFKLHTSSLGKL